ncbi:MAG: glycosyltransferase family 2 protein [Bacteroidales bacterium]|nr:glycosyltransferase family 2 protein [Bacteroidales bacterium]
MNSEILVVIVTFNGMRWLERCIGSVRRSEVPADILAIDNGSTDGSIEWMQGKGIDVVCNRTNLGFGAANNIGIRRAVEEGYSYVYLLNQDAWLAPDTLGKLLKAFEFSNFGILSPVQTDAGGKKMDRQFAKRCGRLIRRHKGEQIVEVPFVMAAHWMISRGCLMQTGGFSPAFTHYGEDDNYLDRARWFGWRCGVATEARAVHDRSDRKATPEQRMYLKCNGSVIRISNPAGGVLLRMLWEPIRLAGTGCLHLSGAPFRFIGTLIRRYPELLRYRKQSRKKGAFLL